VQGQVVDLDDDAVDLVLDRGPAFPVVLDEAQDLFHGVEHAVVRAGR
jgi:hypothetical protein